RLPLGFEANHGQTDDSVKFLARAPGFTLFLTDTEAVLRLQPQRSNGAVRMRLVNARSEANVQGLDELAARSHYLLGNDPSRWRTDVPNFARVRYQSVYPGIDLVYYGNQGNLEYDFVVAPGADPGAIRMEFRGARQLEMDARGNVVLALDGSSLLLRSPLIYQPADGGRRQVPGAYVLLARNQIGVQVGAYDRNRPLVIDPVLTYSTYVGGAAGDVGYAIDVDASGNAYVAGETSSADFPRATPLQATPGGSRDAFVLKLNPAGTALVYSTYLGGSSDDVALGIAVDDSGTAFLAGGTGSTNFPVQNALQPAYGGGPSDAFVSRLNANGSALVFSTYLGANGDDEAQAIALDFSGNPYLTGVTDSASFPTTEGAYDRSVAGLDAFVTKLNPTGSTLVYSTYFGGHDTESGHAIAVDSAGSAYIAGLNIGGSLPTRGAYQNSPGGGTCGASPCPDAFVTKLNSSGSALIYSTYLAGSNADEASGIAVDFSGSAHVTGYTRSPDFPTTDDAPQEEKGAVDDAFVTKLSVNGAALEYSTFLGGGGNDRGLAVAVSPTGNAVIAGQTASSAFPTLNPVQSRWEGSLDAIVAMLNPEGELVFSTYLGGDDSEGARAVAVDSSGDAYVTGGTRSSDFPTANPFQSALGGGVCETGSSTFPCDDVFIAKIGNPIAAPTLSSISPANAVAGGPGFTLTVDGTNFKETSVVRWNGSNRTTTFVSSTQVKAAIVASDIAAAGTAQVTVSEGVLVSNALPFVIISGEPIPTFTAAGLVSAASFNLAGSPPAIASIAALFGTSLASSFAQATSLPLPFSLAGVTVRLNNVTAPLYSVSPGQINFQIPWELLGQTQASRIVTSGSLSSIPVNVNLSAFAPGIFTANAQGTGQGAILIAATGEVVAPVGSIPGRASRPATRGVDFITIYCTGLGDVTNRPASGAAAGSNPLSSTILAPSVTIGSASAPVSFAGLVPGLVGLYQVNVQVPADAPFGLAVPVIVTIGGTSSNTATIAVQ
ncbi:MAG TPA: SBBP repeat-containing protein, partial [Terriglobia bacterium]